ncbi:MAG: shikimate dehydrogenase [Chthoniobacteraceae bacterium]
MSEPREVYTLDDLRRWPEATTGVQPPLRLAVIGDPVAHSVSPQMHNAALMGLGIDVRYTRLHLRPEEVHEALGLLAPQSFIGINCTIPHKTAVYRGVQMLDVTAQLAGGVNTVLVRRDGQLAGFSTDGEGFARAVQESFGVALRDLRVAVLGAAGGAGRAVAMQCAGVGCPRIFLHNRTVEKLNSLMAAVLSFYPECPLTATGLDNIHPGEVDLLVNCTALGMKPGDASVVPPDRLRPQHLVFDTIYTASRTPLMLAADAVGARAENGLPMLLHQGAISFEHWFDRPAPLEVMRAALVAAAPR